MDNTTVIPSNNNSISNTRADEIISTVNDALSDINTDVLSKDSLKIPFTELSAFGLAASSFIPQLHTLTTTINMPAEGLYKIANARPGETLAQAKDGNFWASLRGENGSKRFVKLQEASDVTATAETIAPIDPTMVFVAGALVAINKKLDRIEDLGHKVISFLETQQNSRIKGDLETLLSVSKKFQTFWDNDIERSSNHQMALDINRDARKDIDLYKELINDSLQNKKLITTQSKVSSSFNELLQRFQYYRLALYNFSLSSILEVILSGNFKRQHINDSIEEINKTSMDYRELFSEASGYIEMQYDRAADTFALKGIGTASRAIGSFIGKVPMVNRGPVDEYLQEKGEDLKKNVGIAEDRLLSQFAGLSNPQVGVFVDKLTSLDRLINHTKEIYIDSDNMYFIA